jgi:hypothetical protein
MHEWILLRLDFDFNSGTLVATMLFDSNQSTKVVYNCENHNITRDVYL